MSQLSSPRSTNSALVKGASALLRAIKVQAGADGGHKQPATDKEKLLESMSKLNCFGIDLEKAIEHLRCSLVSMATPPPLKDLSCLKRLEVDFFLTRSL